MDGSIFENPLLIDSNLGSKSNPNAPPVKWVDALIVLAEKVRRITIGWRRSNRGDFIELSGGRWDLPDFKKDAPQEDQDDDRHHGIKEWSEKWAITVWTYGLAQAERNGPGYAQMILYGWNEKKGLQPLGGGTIAKECGDRATSDDVDLGDAGSQRVLAYVMGKLFERLDKNEDRLAKIYENFDKPIAALGTAMTTAVTMSTNALAQKATTDEASREDRKLEREFLERIVQIQRTGETWDRAFTQFGPLVDHLVSDLLGAPIAKGGYIAVAKKLRESISEDQIQRGKALGLGDLITDLLSALEAIEKAPDDAHAKAIIVPVGRKFNAEHQILGQIMTEEQKKLVASLFKFAGMY